MGRGRQADTQEIRSEPRGIDKKNPRERNISVPRPIKEKSTVNRGLDGEIHPQKHGHTTSSEDILVDARSSNVTISDFAKLLEESLARCSECVQTVKESLKSINNDISGMESEMNTFVENIKTFETTDKSCSFASNTPENNEETKSISVCNSSNETKNSEKRGAKIMRLTSNKARHELASSKPRSAKSSPTKKCMFPPISMKPSLTGTPGRSPTNVNSFHDQTGKSKLGQIKKIAKKRSIEQYHQMKRTDEKLIIKSLKDDQESTCLGEGSRTTKRTSEGSGGRNKNANGLAINDKAVSTQDSISENGSGFSKSKNGNGKHGLGIQEKRLRNQVESSNKHITSHQTIKSSRTKSKDTSPYAEKQSLLSQHKNTSEKSDDSYQRVNKLRKPDNRRNNFKLESWKTSDDPGNSSDDILISNDSFGHSSKRTIGMGTKTFSVENQTTKFPHNVRKNKQTLSDKKKRWQ